MEILLPLMSNFAATSVNSIFMSKLLDKLEVGVQQLLQGRLSRSLLSTEELSMGLTRAQEALVDSPYSIVDNDCNFYYNHGQIAYSIAGDGIFISIYVPITSKISHFDIWKLWTLPVPVSHGSLNASMLIRVPEFLGVSSDEEHFLELSSGDLQSCAGSKRLSCVSLPSAVSAYKPSCVISLFFNQNDGVMSHCQFSYQPNYRGEHAISLGDGYYFVSFQTSRHSLMSK